MRGRAGQRRERRRWQRNQGFESRETERDTANGCHSPWLIPVRPTARAKQHPPPYFFFFFFPSFFWALLWQGKSGGANYRKGLFLFFLGGRGARRREGNRAQSMCPNHRGEKKPDFLGLNLLFPDVLLTFLTTRKVSITKILKKEIKESTRIFFKHCCLEQNYFLILQRVWKPPS
jgi:hypothetical protein